MADKLLSFSDGRKDRPQSILGDVALPADPHASRELKSGSGACGMLVFLSVFALIWNGVSWTFFLGSLSNSRGPGLMGAIFSLVFVLIGIGVVVAVVYTLLRLTNPRPIVTIDRSLVRLGETFEVSWKLARPSSRLRRLTISIQGIESATYRQGTDTRTDTATFFEQALHDRETTGLRETWDGSVRACIPASQMHSWQSTNNRIIWQISVKGVIPRWPDIGDHFVLSVAPAGFEPPTPGS